MCTSILLNFAIPPFQSTILVHCSSPLIVDYQTDGVRGGKLGCSRRCEAGGLREADDVVPTGGASDSGSGPCEADDGVPTGGASDSGDGGRGRGRGGGGGRR